MAKPRHPGNLDRVHTNFFQPSGAINRHRNAPYSGLYSPCPGPFCAQGHGTSTEDLDTHLGIAKAARTVASFTPNRGQIPTTSSSEDQAVPSRGIWVSVRTFRS